MKSILLAAAAVLAVPAIAQTTSTTGGDTPTAQSQGSMMGDQSTTGQTMTPPTDADPAAASPSTMGDPSTSGQTMTDPAMSTPPATGSGMSGSAMAGDPGATDPTGGYQPSAPATSGAPAPGATVRFQPAQSPDQAYPAPAPMAKYPVCKRGQYDNCIQRGGR